jgi:hypothetical protein
MPGCARSNKSPANEINYEIERKTRNFEAAASSDRRKSLTIPYVSARDFIAIDFGLTWERAPGDRTQQDFQCPVVPESARQARGGPIVRSDDA